MAARGREWPVTPPGLATPLPMAATRDYPLNLGEGYVRPSGGGPEAQRWFARGMLWAHGFNFTEAAHCCRRAFDADPSCALAKWGEAITMGPNYVGERPTHGCYVEVTRANGRLVCFVERPRARSGTSSLGAGGRRGRGETTGRQQHRDL